MLCKRKLDSFINSLLSNLFDTNIALVLFFKKIVIIKIIFKIIQHIKEYQLIIFIYSYMLSVSLKTFMGY